MQKVTKITVLYYANVVTLYYVYTASQDFIAISTQSSFPVGDQHQSCVDIQILDDTLALEGDIHFLLKFSVEPMHNVITGQPNTSYVVIIDNDGMNFPFHIK